MNKKALKWYLIQRFLIIMLAIYVSGEMISLLYRRVLFPLLGMVLDYQQVQITGSGYICIYNTDVIVFCGRTSSSWRGGVDTVWAHAGDGGCFADSYQLAFIQRTLGDFIENPADNGLFVPARIQLAALCGRSIMVL